ncbi:hypothetical protein P3S68_026873 [Capsicum galapagoense]
MHAYGSLPSVLTALQMDSYYFIPKEGPLHTTKAGIIHRKCQMIRTFLANINTRHGKNIQGNFNVYQYADVDAATRYGVKESIIIDNWKRKIIGSMTAELIQSHKDNKPQMDPQKQKGIQPTVQKIVRAFMVLHGMYPRYDFKYEFIRNHDNIFLLLAGMQTTIISVFLHYCRGDKHKVVKIDWTDFTTQFEHDMEGLQPRFTVQMAASGVVVSGLFFILKLN